MRDGLAAGMIRHPSRADDWSVLCGLGGGDGLLAQARQFLQGREGPDDPGHRLAVGDGDGGKAKLGRAGDKLFGMRSTGQEGEVRGDAQLGIGLRALGGHANSP